MTLVSEGTLPRDSLESADVFLVDTGKELFVWIGSGASPDENKNAMAHAHVTRYSFCVPSPSKFPL